MGALPDVGFFGLAQGTFRVVFPTYNIGSTNEAPGTWRFLHEDYFQTLLEWGWLGAACGVYFSLEDRSRDLSYNKVARRDWTPRRRVMQPLVIIALTGVALHAADRFSASNRIDPVIRRYLSRSLLGKHHVAREIHGAQENFVGQKSAV